MTKSGGVIVRTVVFDKTPDKEAIAKVPGLLAHEFRDQYKSKNIPVVLTQCLDDWPALGKWNPGHFRDAFGDRVVSVDKNNVSLRTFVDNLNRPDFHLYIRQFKLFEHLPEMLPDISPLPHFLRHNWLNAMGCLGRLDISRPMQFELLFGGAGSYFPVIHYDVDHLQAFIMQIYGSKTIYALPPGEAHRLDPDARWKNKSRIPLIGDGDEYPQLRQAKVFVTTLEAGDSLYIPPGWWHGVINPEVSIAVTANMADRFNWHSFSRDWIDARKFSFAKRWLVRLLFNAYGKYRSLASIKAS